MPLYKKWASQIISLLRVDFDEEAILKEAKERYLFTKQAQHLGAQALPDQLYWFNPPDRPRRRLN